MVDTNGQNMFPVLDSWVQLRRDMCSFVWKGFISSKELKVFQFVPFISAWVWGQCSQLLFATRSCDHNKDKGLVLRKEPHKTRPHGEGSDGGDLKWILAGLHFLTYLRFLGGAWGWKMRPRCLRAGHEWMDVFSQLTAINTSHSKRSQTSANWS